MAKLKLPKLTKVVNSGVKKKKVLLLSDDLRMSSGVGTVSKNFVLGTLDKFDWVQVGGAIKHPEEGKVVDMNDSVRKETGIADANLKIYPISGYGSQELLRHLINIEKPDESDEIEEEKTMHQKMYEIATSKYNPFAIGGSESIQDFQGGSENASGL